MIIDTRTAGLTRENGKIKASVFAPGSKSVKLMCNKRSIAMNESPEQPGWFVCSFKDESVPLVYHFENENGAFTDPFARLLDEKNGFGERSEVPDAILSVPDKASKTGKKAYKAHDLRSSVIYKLHVRCFTAHASSGVAAPGTFAGVASKVRYLKGLGITTVLLMPCYDFDEVVRGSDFTRPPERKPSSPFEAVLNGSVPPVEAPKKLNVWGYSAPAAFFAPKASYASQPDKADAEFRSLVGSLHRAGIDVMMEMCFPADVSYSFVTGVLAFWKDEYDIDGFRLMGDNPCIPMLALDPVLTGMTLISHDWDTTGIPDECRRERLGSCNDAFMVNCRRLVKGDEDQIRYFAGSFKDNGGNTARINYFADHDGFTLYDVFCYDVRHNEENGERNRDGREINYSWNCGVEGPTGKKNIRALRLKMCRNALMLLFLSEGVPMINAGDEFLNTAGGNNNYYCCDNETGYVVWEKNAQAREITSFVRKLIGIKRTHPVFANKTELKGQDYLGQGLPDISFHGIKAWMPDYGYYSRTLGILLNGQYVQVDRKNTDAGFFLLINMHWEAHEFDLPTIDERPYTMILASDDAGAVAGERTCTLEGRTAVLFRVDEPRVKASVSIKKKDSGKAKVSGEKKKDSGKASVSGEKKKDSGKAKVSKEKKKDGRKDKVSEKMEKQE
ncbi:MAG: glycogen operon protein GlgX [Lachnospiraceae bacterium]|nr:glycogen operon protein GlgX [Lachnospiraceae bacterium]